ncbi:MAG: hypothetical protein K9L74_07690 [Candidatus Izimaplasma sp.]|nr:hypothetical protein [Candidatus Izimaplasma bacterium]
MSKEVSVREEINNKMLNIFGQSEFPAELQSGLNEVLDLVQNNKTLPDLYEKELKETMVSSSIFQDLAVQMESHYTPHRKLRQVMLQLDDKLGALDSGKNSHKKAIVKCQSLENEVNELQEIYEILDKEDAEIDFDLALRLSNITYTTKSSGMDNYVTNKVINDNVINIVNNNPITNQKYINSIKDKVKIALGNKIVDYEEAQRGMKSSQHMIKDAAIKAHQLRLQADKYSKEVEESDLSFDESEFVYYVMYFTAEIERQLRTGDHQIDRGTYMAVSQLPDFIRKKVQKNIDYIYEKLKNMSPSDDYLFLTDREVLEPYYERDENGVLFVEGHSVNEYLMIEPIRVLSKQIEE